MILLPAFPTVAAFLWQVLAFMEKRRAALARQLQRERRAKQAAMRRRVQSRRAAARHDRQQVLDMHTIQAVHRSAVQSGRLAEEIQA